MRALILTTALVIAGLLWFFSDRISPSLSSAPPGDVAAPPPSATAAPFTNEDAGAAPPPVPDLPLDPGPDENGRSVGHAPTAQTHVVREGDSLWSIALEHYGDGRRARAVYEANRDQIKDPTALRTGQELVLPR